MLMKRQSVPIFNVPPPGMRRPGVCLLNSVDVPNVYFNHIILESLFVVGVYLYQPVMTTIPE